MTRQQGCRHRRPMTDITAARHHAERATQNPQNAQPQALQPHASSYTERDHGLCAEGHGTGAPQSYSPGYSPQGPGSHHQLRERLVQVPAQQALLPLQCCPCAKCSSSQCWIPTATAAIASACSCCTARPAAYVPTRCIPGLLLLTWIGPLLLLLCSSQAQLCTSATQQQCRGGAQLWQRLACEPGQAQV
jgi:hypothetical protein